MGIVLERFLGYILRSEGYIPRFLQGTIVLGTVVINSLSINSVTTMGAYMRPTF